MYYRLANAVGINNEDAKVVAGFAKGVAFVTATILAAHLAMKGVSKLID